MNKFIWILLAVASCSFAKVTPSDVYPNAKAIKIAVANIVNNKIGHSILPVVELDLRGTAPHHVYALASALHYKLAIYMRTHSISGFGDSTFPTTKIGPGDVNDILATIAQNIKKIDSSVYNSLAKKSDDKKPADVMQELLYANLWVDKLFKGKIKPSYPFRVASQIDYELDKIIKHYNLDYKDDKVSTYSKTKPYDVFLNAMVFYQMIALFDTVNHQSKNPLRPYDVVSAGVKVTPVDVYTLSQFILAYVLYVEQRIGISPTKEHRDAIVFVDGKKPYDVYMMYNKAIKKLSFIVSNVKGR
jgi:hypothetical protein